MSHADCAGVSVWQLRFCFVRAVPPFNEEKETFVDRRMTSTWLSYARFGWALTAPNEATHISDFILE